MTSPTKEQAHTADSLVHEFVRCLKTMSHSRAGWDYQLPPAQRALENRQEKDALARARVIWSEYPDKEVLRFAFKALGPLATMSEIEASK